MRRSLSRDRIERRRRKQSSLVPQPGARAPRYGRGRRRNLRCDGNDAGSLGAGRRLRHDRGRGAVGGHVPGEGAPNDPRDRTRAPPASAAEIAPRRRGVLRHRRATVPKPKSDEKSPRLGPSLSCAREALPGGLTLGGRDRGGAPTASAQRGPTVGRVAGDAGTASMARPPRCPNRSAVAHPGRTRRDPAPQGRVPPGRICPDETALYLPEQRAVALADGVVRGRQGSPPGFVPDSLMDDPPATKRALLAAYARLLDQLDFEHLLLAHGDPLIGDGRATLQELVASGGGTRLAAAIAPHHPRGRRSRRPGTRAVSAPAPPPVRPCTIRA